MTLGQQHIRIVEAVNNSPSEFVHARNECYLRGWMDGLKAAGFSDCFIGGLIMDADAHYIAQGIDRPMCGGVWNDWEPKTKQVKVEEMLA